MKNNSKRKLILLILVPFILSYLINILLSIGINRDSSIILSFTSIFLYIWGFIAILFWFYVGMEFGRLAISKVKSFILGNSLWMISFILYIWQFIILNGEERNLFIAGISQNYNLGFISISSQIVSLFTRSIDSRTVIVLSYFLMLLVFTGGFVYTSKKFFKRKLIYKL